MKRIESRSLPPIEYLDAGVGCSKTAHDIYHSGDETQSTKGALDCTTVTPEEIGQQYSEFLRSLGVCPEDASRNARYLCDPKALAQRSETEHTIDIGETDERPGELGKKVNNNQGKTALQVAAAKARAIAIAIGATSNPRTAEFSPVVQKTKPQSTVVFRRR